MITLPHRFAGALALGLTLGGLLAGPVAATEISVQTIPATTYLGAFRNGAGLFNNGTPRSFTYLDPTGTSQTVTGPVQTPFPNTVIGISRTVGDGFVTPGITVTRTRNGDGTYDLSFAMPTQFKGPELRTSAIPYPSVGTNQQITLNYADLFFRFPGAGYSTAPWNAGVSFGVQNANGGVAKGLYDFSPATPTGDYKDTVQLWQDPNHLPQFSYAGYYTPDSAYAPGTNFAATRYLPPVVITGGTKSSATVTLTTPTTPDANGYYDVAVSIAGLTATQAAPFLGSFDVFWGAADCANGAVFGTVEAAPVPEPAAFAAFGLGLLGLAALRRRA